MQYYILCVQINRAIESTIYTQIFKLKDPAAASIASSQDEQRARWFGMFGKRKRSSPQVSSQPANKKALLGNNTTQQIHYVTFEALKKTITDLGFEEKKHAMQTILQNIQI